MESGQHKNKIKRATHRLKFCTLLWLISFCISIFGPKFFWSEESILSIIAIAISMIFGTLMILINIKFLNTLDELQKKIQLDAMGIALGVGIIGGLSYSAMDIVNVISSDAEISSLVMLMSITYLIAIFVGKRQYS